MLVLMFGGIVGMLVLMFGGIVGMLVLMFGGLECLLKSCGYCNLLSSHLQFAGTRK